MIQPSPSERRRHPRFEVMAQVRVKRGRNAYVCDVVNISVSGALIDLGALEQPYWLAADRLVEVILFTPDDEAGFEARSVWATIVRVVQGPDSPRFAVEFEDPDGSVASAVARLVERSAPQPPPLPHLR